MSVIVSILGVPYEVICSNDVDCPRMKGFDGLCDTSTKQIYIENYAHAFDNDPGMKAGNVEAVSKRVLLHEIIHAFLYESGLDANSSIPSEGWATNEEMVDFFAIQYFKIGKVYEEALIAIKNTAPI